jgi:excisionase family DNA binding protein
MISQSPSPAPETAPVAVERLTYSVEESATALGVSKPTIYRLLARRILRPVPGLRHKRIPCQQVRRLAAGEALHGLN